MAAIRKLAVLLAIATSCLAQSGLRFHGVPDVPVGKMRFRMWDNNGVSSDDSLYRIYVANPTSKGAFVQGVKGHKIFVVVTYR